MVQITPLIGEGYAVMTSAAFFRMSEHVPEAPGAFALYVRGGSDILARAGYFHHRKVHPWRMGNYVHLYTGVASSDLRSEIIGELNGCPVANRFRLSLLGLQLGFNAIWNGENGRIGQMHRKRGSDRTFIARS